MTQQERMNQVIHKLELCYPDSACALQAEGDPFRLLVMAILSSAPMHG